MLHISEGALRASLEGLTRDPIFGDLLCARYAAPDASQREFMVESPTTDSGLFASGVAVYSALRSGVREPSATGWRLHDAYVHDPSAGAFFAIGQGGTGRGKRWKDGGAAYARMGLQNRFTRPNAAVKKVLETYEQTEHQGWKLRFTADYIAQAYVHLLDEEPISLWDLAGWTFRFVAIPTDDPGIGLTWLRDKVAAELRIAPGQLGRDLNDAKALRAWFFTEPRPDPSFYFESTPLGEQRLLEVCEAFDPDRGRPSMVSTPDGALRAPEGSGLAATLCEAGNGLTLRVDENVLSAIVTHLALGKHVLLVGPPGTGKTTLAVNAARAASRGELPGVRSPAGVVAATATASWTSFDTVGGLVPEAGGTLGFQRGVFLRAMNEDRWLVLDELNRADVDKALGPLLTLLAGTSEPLALGVEVATGSERLAVTLLPSGHTGSADAQRHVYKEPDGWRLIASMNTYDKNSLYRLSYALMRRLAVVFVDALVPEDTMDVVRAAVPDLGPEDANRLESLLRATDRAGRRLGAAVAIDVAKYVQRATSMLGVSPPAEPFLDALGAYVLPQLDGMEPATLLQFRSALLGDVVRAGHATRLGRLFEQMLDLPAP